MFNKLNRDEHPVGASLGVDADLSNFQKKAIAGQFALTTDTARLLVALSNAGASDATLVELATLKGNAAITAASPTLDMTFNNKVIPVDATSNAVDFQVADDEFTAGFRCILQVLNGTNNISISRSGSTATVNGGTTKSYTTPTAYTQILVSCGEDNKLVANLLAAQTAGNLSDYNFDGNSIFGFDVSINAQTGTTYTLLSSDAGKVITLDNASAITLTVPTGLGANFNCTLVQLGAGQVTISGSGTTVSNRSSHTKIAGQYGVASLLSYADTTWILAGDTSA